MTFLPLVNLWNIREKILYFSILNIKQRYKGTYLGFAWTALEPLFLFLLLYTVFTSIRFRAEDNFAIYLLTGVILFHIFSRGTMGGLGSIRNNSHIIKSFNLPKEIFPVTATTSTAILLVVQVGVFFGLMPFFQFIPPWTVIFLPVVLILVLLLVLGFSYILSIVSVYLRDIQPAWAVIVHALFFVTPIFWYVKDANEILLAFHQVNPLGQILELAHKIMIFGEVPTFNEWLYPVVFVVAIFIFGFAIFKKFESRIAEVL